MEIKTLQKWIEWAEFIDNNSDTDGSQYNKKLVALDDFIESLERNRNKLSSKHTGIRLFQTFILSELKED